MNNRKVEYLELEVDIPYYEQCLKFINKKLDEGLTEDDIVKSYRYLVHYEMIKRSNA